LLRVRAERRPVLGPPIHRSGALRACRLVRARRCRRVRRGCCVRQLGSALTHLRSGWEGTATSVDGLDFASLLQSVGGRIDLLKLDIEGAEIEFLDAAKDADLARVGQLTIEFHDHCGITPRADVVRVCNRLSELGFYRLWSSWRENTHDTLFVHRRVMPRRTYVWQMYPVRYARGIGRVLGRLVHGAPKED
jgi:hypothetical protein